MFTGIVETVAEVVDVSTSDTGARVRIASPISVDLKTGDSIAVSGVCLTVVERDNDVFGADIGPETARVTSLSALSVGRRVNLERSMRLDGRVDGHLVLGHVDGTGKVEQIRTEADSYWVTISFPSGFAPFFIYKGSVAVDGVSLTVAALREGEFDNVFLYRGLRGEVPPDLRKEILTMDIEAVEYYRGGGPIPPEFSIRHADCGVLVLWTRRGQIRGRG